jgi:hypothetical protein
MQNLLLRLLLLMALVPGMVLAEGSKNLTPRNSGGSSPTDRTNTIVGYLQHDDNGDVVNGVMTVNSSSFLKPSTFRRFGGFKEDHRLYIHVKAGETLYYGVRRTPTNNSSSGSQRDLFLTLRYGAGAGTVVKQDKLARDVSSPGQSVLSSGQAGVIETPEQVLNGPNISNVRTNGYNPLVYVNDTGQDQDFYIEFTQENENGGNGAPALTDKLKKSWYDLWDFTVMGAGNQEKAGRLFSRQWSFTSGGDENVLSKEFSLYPLIRSQETSGKYFVKQVHLAGMAPFGFSFVCNEYGSTAEGSRTTIAQRRQSQTSNTGFPAFRIFVSNPDPEVYPSANQPTVSATYTSFCNPQTGGSMAITFRTSEKGSALIILDLNGVEGYQSGSEDVLVQADFSENGFNTMVWDGKDGKGVAVPPNTQVRTMFKSLAAPIHFPLWDVERNLDGFKVTNVRPGTNGFPNDLHWDDALIQTETAFNNPVSTGLFGVNSLNGVHKWGATAADGDNRLVNTWTYGHLEEGSFALTHTYACDFDKDGVNDEADADDDNDGVPDLVEGRGVDPSQLSAAGVPVYLDAAYVHQLFGRFRDQNRDGVNDVFDTDLDGLPNHQDLDSDGDGIPDAVEANGGVAPSWYDVSAAAISGPVGVNGMPDMAETSPESGMSAFPLPDFDGDSHQDLYDLDSDNDGITDRVEAQATLNFVPASGLDQNGNGIDDAHDPGCTPCGTLSGKTVVPVNTNNQFGPDYLDRDTDGDGAPDWVEGFDDNTNGQALDDLVKRSEQFENKAGNPGRYKKAAAEEQGRPGWLRKSIADGIGGNSVLSSDNGTLASDYETPDFLTPGSEFYVDSNDNGLVDLYDPESDGSPSLTPRSETSLNDVDFRDPNTVTPLPVTLTQLKAKWQQAAVKVLWTTASEKNSDRFVVERSADAVSFRPVGQVRAKGNSNSPVNYQFLDKKPLEGVSYYRLRQVDTDGTSQHSKVVAVQSEGGLAKPALKLYPNPADASLELEVAPLAEAATVRITDMTGRVLRSLKMEAGAGGLTLPVSDLPAGVYVVTLTKASGTEHSRFVKK